MHPFSRAPRAFTLVELLAVIAIVGTLVAILIPVIGGVREASRSAECLGNLRQMGPAFLAYATDHRGRYPLSYNSTNDPNNSWWYALAPYLGLKVNYVWSDVVRACAPGGPLGCPSTDTTDSSYVLPWISYKMTRAHRDWMAANGGWSADGPGLPVNRIAEPARSLLVAEGRSTPHFNIWSSADQYNGLIYPHKGKSNTLFADGHAASFTEDELKARWDAFYTHAVQ